MIRTTFEDPFSEELWTTTYKSEDDKSVDGTFKRVSKGIAKAEQTPELRSFWESNFYDMLCGFSITAGGRIYANAGTAWGGTTLMNCFAGPRDPHDIDSLETILSHILKQSLTLKSEGGWGDNFSYLRPRGAFIKGIGAESPGAVRYMELFDKSSDIITSGSGKDPRNPRVKPKIRKGAMMGVMDVWHPDIVEFITAKQKSGRLTKFNMSVNCTDSFMLSLLEVIRLKESKCEASLVEEADKWELIFPQTDHPSYEKEWNGSINEWRSKGYPVEVYETTTVSKIWELIMKSTYNRAEPGILFLDRANHFHPANYVPGKTIFTTNPCGEQTLPPAGVCDLGSINLTQFITKGRQINWNKLKKYTIWLVRFLDNVNDISHAPLPEYQDSMTNMRRIGVGVLGWGSSLYMMKIRFGSDEAQNLRDKIMKVIAIESYKASIDLAEEKGMFSYCNPELHAKGAFIQSLGLPEEYMEKLKRVGIRNSSILSMQPTGNTSIFANVVSGGIEPVFQAEYTRTVILGNIPDEIVAECPKWFEGEWHETGIFKFTKEGDEQILRGIGPETDTVYKIDKNRGLTKEVSCQDYAVRWLKERDEWDPEADWAVTTSDLNVQDHVNDLVGFSKYVDAAISKTVNLPNDYTFEDFQNVYVRAYETGYIKGITTYRAGTMAHVLSAKEEKDASDSDEEIILDSVKLPGSAPARLKTLKADGKKWYLTVVYTEENPERPFALFVKTNQVEHSVQVQDAVSHLLALAREKDIPESYIKKLESGIKTDTNPSKVARCISLLLRHGVMIRNIVRVLNNVKDVYVGSFVFQIRKFLASYIKDGELVENAVCDSCGSDSVVYAEGCMTCQNCGSTKCG